MKKGKFEKKIEKIDEMIKTLERIGNEWPEAGFEKMINRLRQDRAEITSQIGKRRK